MTANPGGKRCLRAAIGLSLLVLAGCAAVPEKGGFDQVRGEIDARTGQQVEWRQDQPEDRAIDAEIEALLAKPLTPRTAVQVALLNNRQLQATYEQLGLAQANLVQAGLLANPVFSAEIGFPEAGGQPELAFGIAQNFLSVLYRPLRRSIAQAEFAAAKKRVTAAVIALAADVRTAYYQVQADLQTGELLEQTVAATAASFEAAQTLRQAGNTTQLQLFRQQALHEEARLLLAEAQAQLVNDREHLNRLLGAWDEQLGWSMPPRLPAPPDNRVDLSNLEQRAVAANLELTATRSDLLAAARRAGLAERTDLLPDLDIGAAADREESAWDTGPTLDFAVPLFDQGQAHKAAAYARVRQLRQRYYALGVDIRSAARAAGYSVSSTRQRAQHVAQVVLPLRSRIVGETQKQVNAMQLGVFDLLLAQRQQINAGLEFVETRRAYWNARTQLQRILNGGHAEDAGTAEPSLPGLDTGMATGGH